MNTEQNTISSRNNENTLLAADADYWLTASSEEVKKYLLENTDMKEYEFKKQQLLCKIQEKLKSK